MAGVAPPEWEGMVVGERVAVVPAEGEAGLAATPNQTFSRQAARSLDPGERTAAVPMAKQSEAERQARQSGYPGHHAQHPR